MRIAVWHNLPSGGGKRALYDQISGLLERGHDVECWCPPTADQSFLPLNELVTEHVVPLGNWDHPARRLLGKASWGATDIYTKLKMIDEHTRRCAGQINKSHFDIFLGTSSMEVAVASIARYVNLPSVLYLHEPLRGLYEANPTLPWVALDAGGVRLSSLIRRLRNSLRVRALRVQAREELESARAYDRILVNSYFSRESTLRAYNIDARVCYLGVDTDRYVDLGLPRENLVVGLGAIVHEKRVHTAIDAVAALADPRPELTWIGNVTNEKYLHDITASARSQGVRFSPLVAIEHDRVIEILNRASVMIYAPRLEPFGYAPIEAAACGLPVVARAEGGVRESVIDGETGFLVDDDLDLAPALGRLLADEELAGRMAKSARHTAETKWSLRSATDRLEANLLAVLNK